MANQESTISSPSENGSEGSTLSAFVLPRLRGDVGIFGGDPRVGARQFAMAAGNSVYGMGTSAASYGADVYSELRRLGEAVHNLQVRAVPPEMSPVTPKGVPPGFGEIQMVNNDESRMKQDFEKAATLDGDKVQMLLAASLIDPRDVSAFQSAIRIAKQSAARKLAAIEEKEARKKAKSTGPVGLQLHDSRVDWDNARVRGVAALAGFDENELTLRYVALAVMHESVMHGVQTNRALAQLGDSALKTVLLERLARQDFNIPVGVISDVLVVTQCNTALYSRAYELGLYDEVLAASGFNANTRDVLATVVEALYGVAWLIGGVVEVERLDVRVGVVTSGLELMKEKLSAR